MVSTLLDFHLKARNKIKHLRESARIIVKSGCIGGKVLLVSQKNGFD